MNVGVFIELERIKKPSPVIFETTRMFCLFANSFRDKPLEEDLSNWTKI